jgi:hypothetical protein
MVKNFAYLVRLSGNTPQGQNLLQNIAGGDEMDCSKARRAMAVHG